MQVIQQLRHGVKLKKIDPAQIHHPIEYALTPYEMLLDDIRSRRYKLRQVMVRYFNYLPYQSINSVDYCILRMLKCMISYKTHRHTNVVERV